jgi:putative transposase
MAWHVISVWTSMIFDIFRLVRMPPDEKDVEILLLRQQLMIVRRKQNRGPNINRLEKVMLLALCNRLTEVKRSTRAYIAQHILLFKPDTILRWHRELVKKKWTFDGGAKLGGRPPLDGVVEALIVKLARENNWGAGKIQGELKKLGYRVSDTTILNVLRRYDIPAQPERQQTSSWRTFLNHHKDHILACDFFTIETLRLQTIYVLFFIEIGTRRLHIAGFTPNPNGQWVAQQARQLVWKLEDDEREIKYLIRDRDSKFQGGFDAVLESSGIETIKTPVRAPNANAFAERWVRSIREECLDRILILNHRHLRRVLSEYEQYYNEARPHQGIDQEIPAASNHEIGEGPVRCRNVLGGILHDYHRAA